MAAQGIHSGFGGCVVLLCRAQGSFGLFHPGAQGGAVGFQQVQRGLRLRPLGVGQGFLFGKHLLFQCLYAGRLSGSGAVSLLHLLFQRRALAGVGLPVGFQFLAPQQRDEVMYKPAAALEAALEESWNGPIWQSLKTPWLDGLDK